jgi:hypothetical protein
VLEFDAVNLEVPAKDAFTVTDPAGSVEVVIVALPPDSTAVPIFVEPLKKLTDPVGVAVPLVCFTTALNVTGEFSVMLADDAASVVEVPTTAAFTVMVTALDAEALNPFDPA